MNRKLLGIACGAWAAAGFVILGAQFDTLAAATIQAEYYYPDLSTIDTGWSFSPSNPFTTPATETLIEFGTTSYATIDFSANSVVIQYVNNVDWFPATFSGPVFTVLAGSPFDPVTSVSGIAPGLVFDTGSMLGINWQGLDFTTGDEIEVTFASSAVPEPSTSAMMLIGLAGLGFAGYRRTRKRTAWTQL